MPELEFNNYLPPYRSLLNPSVTYDYQKHRQIQVSPLDIKLLLSKFQIMQLPAQSTQFKMKYRSLLLDVSIKASLLSRKVLTLKQPLIRLFATRSRTTSFFHLPLEVQLLVFRYVDDPEAYRRNMLVCKLFYQLLKPFLYRLVSFTSTYRFAQFIAILRLNPQLASFVIDVDLLNLKPGNYEALLAHDNREDDDQDIDNDAALFLACWRDWKFQRNLYVLHSTPQSHIRSAVPAHTPNARKRMKLANYFKRRKSQSNVTERQVPHPRVVHHHGPPTHPKANRVLLSYASSRDVPVGYVLHLINMCSNLQSLNIANLSLSSDYRVVPIHHFRYQPYDLVNNYHKDLKTIVNSLAPRVNEQTRSTPTFSSSPLAGLASSASSVFSIPSFSAPAPKYNSLLPPIKTDKQYLNHCDGNLFLSDLTLKSINTTHLQTVLHREIFSALAAKETRLQSMIMTSVIWIDAKLVREYLILALKDNIRMTGGHWVYSADDKPFVLDLTDSGMERNLPWARRFDTTERGQKLIENMLNDQLLTDLEESAIAERNRRGAMGQNFFS